MKYNLANNEPLEINGDVYVKGVGTYDGTNAGENGVKTLKDILNSGVTEITWNDLVNLRDNNELIPGQYYRITDYTCTTTTAGTKSAGHVFDIIVRADSENKLNEEASAIQHMGDEYFANCDLSAWRLWYCLDNDTTRFVWANNSNDADGNPVGRGVIYRMIDEFNNDCPYDFKNIQFYRQWDSSKSLWSTIPNNNTGVPCYTFSSEGNSSTTSFTDMSLVVSNRVYSNVIKEYIDSNKQTLNNNCFFGSSCYYNTFGSSCYFNTFGSSCYSNTFGIDCSYNTFGSSCYSNTFGSRCYSNTFGIDCSSNSFGNNCDSNTFGNRYYSNSFGNGCNSNTFGNRYYFNSFGNGCKYNSFRASADKASALKSYVYYNHFDDGCSYNVIWNSDTTSSSVLLKNINVNRGVVGTSNSYNMINIDILNSEQEINVNQVGGIVSISKSIGSILSITYESLKTLRDSSKLIPGQQYRIIDYITTTSQENTQSAGHQFDIIVTALDEHTLSEEAQAIQNINDSYFDSSNLSAWKIWYCLDNDTNRFAWADGDRLIGTIKPTTGSASGTYTYSSPIYKIVYGNKAYNLEIGVRTQIYIDPPVYITKTDDYTLVVEDEYKFVVDSSGVRVYTGGQGVIYRMIDEFNNDVPYDFKNIQFKRYKITSSVQGDLVGKYATPDAVDVTVDDSTPYWCYTFSTDSLEDVSLDGYSNLVYNNIIPKFHYGLSLLNNIVFIGKGNLGNRFGVLCSDSTFGNNCYGNIFGNNCSRNTFGGECYYNIFGNSCSGNTFGNNIEDNTFGNYCNSNTFGDSCKSNTFGNDCRSITFGDNCSYNTFGNACSSNTFGDNCSYNTFGNACYLIKFASDSATSTKYSYYRHNHFGDGCQYILFKGADTASPSSQVQNYNFAQGLQGTSSSYLTIEGVRNLSYEVKVAKNSKGEIKIYCEADLIA